MTDVRELGVVSSSLDTSIKIYDVSRGKVTHTVRAHSLGVHCFAYSKAFSMGISGGLERDIMMWQPNSTRKAGELVGHGASITHIAVDNRRSQV